MNENEKLEIVKRVLKELKTKNLLTTSKSSYKSTEKILYSLNVLPDAISLIDKEIKQLEQELISIPKPNAKSNKLVLNEEEGTYIYGDEMLETRISELKQISIKTRSQIRLVKNALKNIRNDKYYEIVNLYYFKRMTIEEVAEEMDCSVGAISKHKKRLINELKIYIFPNTFIEEL